MFIITDWEMGCLSKYAIENGKVVSEWDGFVLEENYTNPAYLDNVQRFYTIEGARNAAKAIAEQWRDEEYADYVSQCTLNGEEINPDYLLDIEYNGLTIVELRLVRVYEVAKEESLAF